MVVGVVLLDDPLWDHETGEPSKGKPAQGVVFSQRRAGGTVPSSTNDAGGGAREKARAHRGQSL